ncbi:hypothetical protein N7463_005950 [Penicillium fimorum]|uniref:Uncharacterized protein n=1 Tax=Penicillium fimorum TaxID=1882269 RepID=A0A9X0C668_9EURO|nr:hypothetical protein N7463_005950 [Penicillium fimorum]
MKASPMGFNTLNPFDFAPTRDDRNLYISKLLPSSKYTGVKWTSGCGDSGSSHYLSTLEKVIIIARSEDRYITAREEWRHREGISLENDT